MRTKIIAGNLVAVLVVGLVSYFVVSSQIQATFVEEVNSQIVNDHRLFGNVWRLSGLELMEHAQEQATSSDSRDIFTALDEAGQRTRANRRANEVRDFLGRRSRIGGPPEVVAITNAEGRVIARDHDLNRMHDNDLRPQLRTLAPVLATGDAAIDVWTFSDGQTRLLQTAIAPIRDQRGGILGTLIVGYDMSNGMASRAGELLGRDVAFVKGDGVYSSSLDGHTVSGLRGSLFSAVHEPATRAALQEDGATSIPWVVQIGDNEYVAVTGAVPNSPSTDVAYVVLGNRTEQADKAQPTLLILVMTLLGVALVLVYGFLIGTSFLKPIEQMEEGILAVINGRTDVRLDIQSQELGGLAYRINQLLNVFTGTPEEDEEGRVSSPPDAWASEAADQPSRTASTPMAAGAGAGTETEDPELAARLAAEPEGEYYTRIYREYVAAKEAIGENVSSITEDRFVQRLKANEASLLKKHGCRMVRFTVQTRANQVNLQPVIIR